MHWKEVFPIALICFAPEAAHSVEYLSVAEAQAECFPQAEFLEAHQIFTPEQMAEIKKLSGVQVKSRGQQIWIAREDQKISGYFVVDYVIGKHLVIDYSVGINPDGTVRQVDILKYRESYGGEVHRRDWLKQFNGKNYEAVLRLNQDIVNISGATLSSRHITEGVKRVLSTIHVLKDQLTIEQN